MSDIAKMVLLIRVRHSLGLEDNLQKNRRENDPEVGSIMERGIHMANQKY